MAHIDDLVQRIADDTLRAQVSEEVAKLLARKDFGLVYQNHLPEDIEVAGVRPRRGDEVRIRGNVDRKTFVVSSAQDGIATVIPVDAAKQPVADAQPEHHLYADLVTVKDFGTPIYPGLKMMESLQQGGQKPSHLVIEGENYYALETLLYTHERKIDVIYIDPPYNTGSDDWQYNDKYIDGTDSYRHSKWLAFMERRLRHAHRLLKDTGVIFVSIDDNEQAHLRLLLDDIFKPANFLDTIVVEMSTTSGPKVVNAQQGTIVKNVEYVHVYKKSDKFDQIKHTPLLDSVPLWDGDYALWLNDDGTITNFIDELVANPAVKADIDRFGFVTASGRFQGMNAMDKLLAVSTAANNFVQTNLDRIARRDIPPASCKNMDAPVRGWIKVEADHRSYLLTRLRSGTLNQVYTLARNFRESDDYRPRFGRTVIRGDLWKGFYQDMGNIAKEGGVAFNNGKKPIRLIKQLVRWANNSPDAVVLDFFGGSGSTTHAVMSMNAEDGGQRQSIVVTNNELPKDVARRLRRQKIRPGDTDWEAEGVFWKVLHPRIKTVVTGKRPDGTVHGEPASENVAFLKLTFEDENLIALGRKFEAIAPLLWLKAGAVGPICQGITSAPWLVPVDGVYAILFDAAQAKLFSEVIAPLEDQLRHIFVVTDSQSAFQAAVAYLPASVRLETTRLYADYLHSFEINGKG